MPQAEEMLKAAGRKTRASIRCVRSFPHAFNASAQEKLKTALLSVFK